MANTWGLQTWGFNQWNDLDNVSYTLTGQDLSLSLADVTTSGEINEGWGRANTWGIWLGNSRYITGNWNSQCQQTLVRFL
jgi:hypothetical protein